MFLKKKIIINSLSRFSKKKEFNSLSQMKKRFNSLSHLQKKKGPILSWLSCNQAHHHLWCTRNHFRHQPLPTWHPTRTASVDSRTQSDLPVSVVQELFSCTHAVPITTLHSGACCCADDAGWNYGSCFHLSLEAMMMVNSPLKYSQDYDRMCRCLYS